MKIKLKKPSEWGHYIDSESLEICELVGDIPNNSLVIIRKREFRTELSRNVIITSYANVSKNMLNYLSKNDFTKKLSKKCSQYMLEKNKIPPKITIAKEMVENKPAELVYSFSSDISFQFKISEQLLEGKNPKEYIENLISSSDRDFFKVTEERRWKIEYAPNGRALCKKCRRQIREKEIRLGELQIVENQLIKQFCHYRCIDWSKLKDSLVLGISDLTEIDQQQIRKKLKLEKEGEN